MLKVSIIVPVYNAEKYIKECIESLINQTLKEIEIICINDGSTDNSLNILKDYEKLDNRIKIIDKENAGQSVARNLGIEMAKGEFLGFVDSDDWVDSDYFEKLYNAAIDLDSEISCAGYIRCKKNKNSVKKSYTDRKMYNDINSIIKADNIPNDNYVWNKIYKRETWIEKGIKFQAGRYFEDLAIVVKILHLFGSLVTVPDTYYYYRVNPNSTVAKLFGKHKTDYRWALESLRKYSEENNINLDYGNIIFKKEYIKLMNITLMKIYHYEDVIKYNLLGFIPFIKKITM